MSDISIEDRFVVVMNAEEQYALWPSDLSIPPGWDCRLEAATREECLAFVERHWTDMRPASLRREVMG